MLISMTGQGQASSKFRDGTVEIEIRAVNNRFLKVTTRIADPVAAIEPEVESIVRAHVKRGSISVSIALTGSSETEGSSINSLVLASYLRQAAQAAEQVGWTLPVGDFLALPGVVCTSQTAQTDDDNYLQPVRDCLVAALLDLQAMRLREGQAMAQQFRSTLEAFRIEVRKIQSLAGSAVKEYEARLETKVRQAQEKLGIQFEAGDIIREVTLFADRSDICEEIVRFASHIEQMENLIDSQEPAGRKLEFLTQEMHRETNTIGSKSSDAEIAASVIEIKAMIEQLREIVQNVE